MGAFGIWARLAYAWRLAMAFPRRPSWNRPDRLQQRRSSPSYPPILDKDRIVVASRASITRVMDLSKDRKDHRARRARGARTWPTLIEKAPPRQRPPGSPGWHHQRGSGRGWPVRASALGGPIYEDMFGELRLENGLDAELLATAPGVMVGPEAFAPDIDKALAERARESHPVVGLLAGGHERQGRPRKLSDGEGGPDPGRGAWPHSRSLTAGHKQVSEPVLSRQDT